jgi:hypothetical protein
MATEHRLAPSTARFPAIDFASSFVTFFVEHGEGNIARLQVDAACTLDLPGGASAVYYLIAPCRAEDMYRGGQLFKLPNYEFAGIFGTHDFRILRFGWSSAGDSHEYGENRVRFLDVRLDVRTLAGATPLDTVEQIVEATLDNVPLVGRTEIVDDHTQRRAILEYPIRTMNVTRSPQRFQVDTGPLIVPDFAATAPHAVEHLDLAFVAFNGFDKAEFIRRRPTPLTEGAGPSQSTTDYSSVSIIPARNTILRAR